MAPAVMPFIVNLVPPRLERVSGGMPPARGPWAPPGLSPEDRSPLDHALGVLGHELRTLVLWHLCWGPRPFFELLRGKPRLTRRELRRELASLASLGLVLCAPGSDRRAVYALTARGQTLRPVLAAMYEWGLRAWTEEHARLGAARATQPGRIAEVIPTGGSPLGFPRAY